MTSTHTTRDSTGYSLPIEQGINAIAGGNVDLGFSGVETILSGNENGGHSSKSWGGEAGERIGSHLLAWRVTRAAHRAVSEAT